MALGLILALVIGFGVVVFLGARCSDGGSYVDAGLVLRMQRSPEERAEFNRWAFYAHRITGFAIFAFLCLHIIDTSLYSISPRLFDEVHVLYGSSPMRVFECGLLFAILFHTFNGLRILAIDVADLGIVASRRLLVASLALTVVLSFAGSAVIMAPVLT